MPSDRSEPRPFAIIASQRTGSTLLVRSLDSAESVFCAGELFRQGPHVYHGEYSYQHQAFGSHVAGRLADKLIGRWRIGRHLDRFYSNAGVGVLAVGLKVMLSHLRRHPAILPELLRRNCSLLFLKRRDHFATALSYFKAVQSGVFHSDRVHGSAQPVSLIADPQEFEGLLHKCRQEHADIAALHAAHGGALLDYEDMTADWDAFIDRVGKELGLDGLRVPKALEKVGSAEPIVHVANEEELRRALGTTGR